MIYFDNAATSGRKPQSVINAVNNALKNLSANPGRSGHDLSLKTADAIYGVRSKIANFFGANGPENVVFTQNCTHAINCVIKGTVSIGEHIVVSNLEHNSVMRPLKKSKISYTVANVGENVADTLENFKNAIKPNTKLVFVSGASNVTGQILPLREIGEICKKRGILFGVDGAQLAGIVAINMQKDNIDFLCVAPHKGLYAPMGIGILICRKPLKNTIIEGGTGTDSYDFLQPLDIPEGFESGTVNVPAIMGVGAGIDFVENLTLQRIYKHEFSLLEMLYKKLSQMEKILLYTKPPIFNENVAVLPFNIKDNNSNQLAEFLNSNGVAVRSGLHCAPSAHQAIGSDKNGACRVSFGVYNNKQEIEKFCAILRDKKINKL